MTEAVVSPGTRWGATLEGNRAAAAIATAREVAARLSDHGRVQDAIAAAGSQTAYPKSAHWDAASVAQGDAGLAILFASLDACFPGEGWDVAGHESLALAARQAERSSYLPAGLFSGLSGLALAAWSLSRQGARYQRLLETLESALVPQAATMSLRLTRGERGISVGEFDVISGLSGVGAYLLSRLDGPGSDEAVKALDAVLRGLAHMTLEAGEPPAWYTPPALMADETMARQYPAGNLNCGLAHGIPGPLAIMALALRHGISVEGQVEAVERIAEWLARHRTDDEWGVNWPTVVALPVDGEAEVASRPEPSRSAWCYGSPGVARPMWMAGAALGRHDFCDLAVEGMKAVFRRPVPERRIDSPTFCHGIAGLLQVAVRFARDTGHPEFLQAVDTLTDQLLTLHEPESLLGYRNLEPGGGAVDQPGLLDGAPGVAMVLLAAASDVEPVWDRLFLLS